jgi:hypothetical protein
MSSNLLDSMKAKSDADALAPRGIPMTDAQWHRISAVAKITRRSRAYVVRTAVDRFLEEVGEVPTPGAPTRRGNRRG